MVIRNYLLGFAMLAFGLVALAVPAHAGPIVDGIEIVGGTAGSIPSPTQTNDVFGETVSGYFGADLEIVNAGSVRFEYIGAEASWVNRFVLDGSVVYTHGGVSSPETYGKTVFSTNYSAGDTIDFGFLVNGNTDTSNLDVENGSNPDNSASNVPNFFVVYLSSDLTLGSDSMFEGLTLTKGLYLALDDAGAGDDDNHDDMVIKISAVPEPMTLVLFGGGLAVIAARRRKRKGEITV